MAVPRWRVSWWAAILSFLSWCLLSVADTLVGSWVAAGLYFLGGNYLSPRAHTCTSRQVPEAEAALHGNLHLRSLAHREIVSAYLKNLREAPHHILSVGQPRAWSEGPPRIRKQKLGDIFFLTFSSCSMRSLSTLAMLICYLSHDLSCKYFHLTYRVSHLYRRPHFLRSVSPP